MRLYEMLNMRALHARAASIADDPVMGIDVAFHDAIEDANLDGWIADEFHWVRRKALGLTQMSADKLWRTSARAIWQIEIPMVHGGVWVRTADCDHRTVTVNVLQSLLDLFTEEPNLRRAFVNYRTWFTSEPIELLVYVRIAPDEVRPILVDPRKGWSGIIKEIRRWRELEANRELAIEVQRLFADWVEQGTLWSLSPIAVSPVPTVPFGNNLLLNNGTSLSLTVCEPSGGTTFLGLTFDHRVFDAEHAGVIYQHLREDVRLRCGLQ